MLPGINMSAASWKVVEAPSNPPEIHFVTGDSRGPGVIARGGGDPTSLGTGVYAYKHSTDSIVQTVPLEHIAQVGGNIMSFMEPFATLRQARIGANVYIVPIGVNGAKTDEINVTQVISWANAAVAKIVSVEPTAVVKSFAIVLGTNDFIDPAVWKPAYLNVETRLRNEVYRNGVSGATLGSSMTFVHIGERGEQLMTTPNTKNYYEVYQRERGAWGNNGYIPVPTNATNNADGLHESIAGIYAIGADYDALLADTTPAALSFPSAFSVYADQVNARTVGADKYVYPSVNDANFEIDWVWPGKGEVASGPGTEVITPKLQFAGGGTLAVGTYTPTLSVRSGTGTVATQGLTVTSVAAYGSSPASADPTGVWIPCADPVMTTYPYNTLSNILLKGGYVTEVTVLLTGGAYGFVSAKASNGLVGAPDPSNTNSNGRPVARYYFYSPVDETVNIDVRQTGSGSTVGTVTAYTDTKPLPLSSFAGDGSVATTSMTCPANGIVSVTGYTTGSLTPPSGQTNFTKNAEANSAAYGGYRTTTGSVGAGSGFMNLFASAWEKAT